MVHVVWFGEDDSRVASNLGGQSFDICPGVETSQADLSKSFGLDRILFPSEGPCCGALSAWCVKSAEERLKGTEVVLHEHLVEGSLYRRRQ